MKKFGYFVVSLSLFLILLPSFVWSQQSLSIDATSWFLKPQNKKEKSNSIVIFFLKNNEACVLFQDFKGGDLGLFPVRIGKRPIWNQNGSDYVIKFQDRDLVISGKIINVNSLTATTKGNDDLLKNESGFAGESLRDPKPSFNSLKFLVPFPWLTITATGRPKWEAAIKAEGLDLCNPLEDPIKQKTWFPPSK